MAKKLLFIGLELIEVIKSLIGSDPIGKVGLFTQHVTLAFMPNADVVAMYEALQGKLVEIKICEYARSETHEGYAVELPSWLPYANASLPHITIAVANGANAANTPCLFGGNVVVPDNNIAETLVREKRDGVVYGRVVFYYN